MGGLGFTDETRVSRLMLDCRGFQIGGGSNSGVTEKLRFYTAADIAGVAFSDAAYREATEEDKAVFAQLSKIYEQI